MDDLTHNCPNCHEVTRAPDQHTCGRNPQGRLPAHQPHKSEAAPPDLLEAFSLIRKAFEPFAEALKSIGRAVNKPDTQSDFTLAGPSKGPTK